MLLFAGKVDTVSQYTDHSGHLNHAIQPTAANQPTILTGSDSVAINANKGGSCYNFDGVDNYLYLTNNIDLSAGGTILGWYNCDALTTDNQIISGFNAANGDRFSIQLMGDDSLRMSYFDGTNTYPLSFSATEANVWNYYAFTFDGTATVTAYLNHDRLPDGANAPESTSNAGVFIGCRQDTVNFFEGKMVGIRIYDEVLTSAQILARRKMDISGMVA